MSNNFQLREAFNQFKKIPFPRSSSNILLGNIHDELIEYDSFLAGLINSYLSGKSINIDLVSYDIDLEKKIREYISTKREETALAEQYLQYMKNLKKMIDLVKVS